MAALQCEICGGKLIGKPGGVFECDSCGMEYSTEWAKAKVQEIRGTVKIEGPVEVTGTVKVEGGPSVENLLKRGNTLLTERKWTDAETYFNRALELEPENAEAYLGLTMADWKIPTRENFTAAYISGMVGGANKNFERAKQFARDALKNWLEELERRKEEEFQRKVPILAERRKRLAPAAGLIGASYQHTVGLKADGTVVAVGSGQCLGLKADGTILTESDLCNVGGWRDIVAVSEGGGHTVGLKADGTVVATGSDSHAEEQDWRDIVAVSVGGNHTVGLKSDGTVVAAGHTETGWADLPGWRDIVAVAAGASHIAGLKSDGTVVVTGDTPYDLETSEVQDWQDIVAVAAGDWYTVGLKADGTVVAAGKSNHVPSGVWDWQDIVAIAAGSRHTVGLKADGTVVITGKNDYDVGSWADIVAVATGDSHIVGLKADGTVVAIGDNEGGACKVGGWKLFNSLDTLEQEREQVRAARQRQEAERKRQEEEARQAKIAVLEAEKQSLQAEIAGCKGLFSGGKRRELEARLANIEEELKKL